MELSAQTKIEAQIGFTVGILIGAIAAGIVVFFFSGWEWYFRYPSLLGSIGIIGMLSMSLGELLKMRKRYLESKKLMEETTPQPITFNETSEIPIETAINNSKMKGGKNKNGRR